MIILSALRISLISILAVCATCRGSQQCVRRFRRTCEPIRPCTASGIRNSEFYDNFRTSRARGWWTRYLLVELCFLTLGILHSDFYTGITVKYIPSWFPGAGFQKYGAHWRRETEKLISEPYERVKANLVCDFDLVHDFFVHNILSQAAGQAVPSFVSRLLEDEKSDETTDLTKMWVAGVMCASSSFPYVTDVLM